MSNPSHVVEDSILIEALQTAFLNLSRRADSRAKWTGSDQRAYEQVRAALVSVGAELPVSTLVREVSQ